jgi:hypothetical protein
MHSKDGRNDWIYVCGGEEGIKDRKESKVDPRFLG